MLLVVEQVINLGFQLFLSSFASDSSSHSPTARKNVKSKSGIPEKSSEPCIANIPMRATALVLAEVVLRPDLAQIAQGTQTVVIDEDEGAIEALVLILRHPVNNPDTHPSETLNILKTRISATRHVMISLNPHILRMGMGAIKVRIVKQHLLSIHEPGASSQLVKGQRVNHPHGASRNTGMV